MVKRDAPVLNSFQNSGSIGQPLGRSGLTRPLVSGQFELLAHRIHGILAHQLAQPRQQSRQVTFNLAASAVGLQRQLDNVRGIAIREVNQLNASC
ncbi:hypothetical protein [Candidatus Poriferisocius sp.]|uniref:hypothetical protein n=1 Tax=Candidatus Poriferisocius sp. TaxID=3101276 RepID=UPI003B016883